MFVIQKNHCRTRHEKPLFLTFLFFSQYFSETKPNIISGNAVRVHLVLDAYPVNVF